MLIGSRPCVAFSQLQTMIPDSERIACQLKEGMQHMGFMVRVPRAAGQACRYARRAGSAPSNALHRASTIGWLFAHAATSLRGGIVSRTGPAS